MKSFWGKNGPGWPLMRELIETETDDAGIRWKYQLASWLTNNRDRVYNVLKSVIFEECIWAYDDNKAISNLNRTRRKIFKLLHPDQTPPKQAAPVQPQNGLHQSSQFGTRSLQTPTRAVLTCLGNPTLPRHACLAQARLPYPDTPALPRHACLTHHRHECLTHHRPWYSHHRGCSPTKRRPLA